MMALKKSIPFRYLESEDQTLRTFELSGHSNSSEVEVQLLTEDQMANDDSRQNPREGANIHKSLCPPEPELRSPHTCGHMRKMLLVGEEAASSSARRSTQYTESARKTKRAAVCEYPILPELQRSHADRRSNYDTIDIN